MRNIASSASASCLLLLLISIGMLFFRLGALPFTGSDEPRYARIAEEMRQRQHWVTPLLQGRPWLEKPPLYYWITIPVFAAMGSSETSARLGPAFCALLSSLAILWVGRRLFNPLAGLYSGLILLTSLGFAGFGRGASMDMLLTACLSVALAIGLLRTVDPNFPTIGLWSAYVFLGLAVLAKGPVALVVAAGIGALFWWLDERGSARRWNVGRGLLITGTIAVPWFWLAFRQNGFSFISVFFVNHNLARFVSEIHHHSQPFYYYIPVLLLLFFPWSGWLLLLLPRRIWMRERETDVFDAPAPPLSFWQRWSPVTLFLVCWFVLPMLFFSLSRSKLPGYILPCLPPLALLLGKRMAEELHVNDAGRSPWRATAWFYLFTSMGAAAAILAVFEVKYGGRWQVGLLLGLVIVVPALFAFQSGRHGNLGPAVASTVAQGLLLVVAAAEFAFPVLGASHSTRDIARQTLAARENNEPAVTYRFFHHTLHYYTGYQIAADLQDSQALARFAMTNPRFLVVTEAGHMEDLKKLQGYSSMPLGQQGKLRLLRVAHR